MVIPRADSMPIALLPKIRAKVKSDATKSKIKNKRIINCVWGDTKKTKTAKVVQISIVIENEAKKLRCFKDAFIFYFYHSPC